MTPTTRCRIDRTVGLNRARMCGVAIVVVLGLTTPVPASAQTTAGTDGTSWHAYGGDLASTKYAPLDEINASNVGDVEITWRWSSAEVSPPAGKQLPCDPADGGRNGLRHRRLGPNGSRIGRGDGRPQLELHLRRGKQGPVGPLARTQDAASPIGKTETTAAS